MKDLVFDLFMRSQREALLALAEQSDLLRAEWLDPQRAVLHFSSKGLLRAQRGEPREHSDFGVGMAFAPDHLRRVDPMAPLTLLWPADVFYPNVRGSLICAGHLRPGIRATELAYTAFEILVGRNRNVVEREALSHEAAVWYRRHPERLPIDPRPLLWRAPKPEAGAQSAAAAPAGGVL